MGGVGGGGCLCVWGGGGCTQDERRETSQDGGRRKRVLVIGWRREQDGCGRVGEPRGNRTGGIVGKAGEGGGAGGASVLHPAGVWSSSQVPRGTVLPISIP